MNYQHESKVKSDQLQSKRKPDQLNSLVSHTSKMRR